MRAIIGLIMVVLSATAYGQLMKCIGKDGRVEYASQCPPGSKEQPIGIRSTPSSAPSDSATPEKSLAERDAEFRKRQTEKKDAEAKEAQKTAEDQQRRRACESARAYLQQLEARNRVVKYDAKTGERVYLDDAQYASEIAATQRSIQENCK